MLQTQSRGYLLWLTILVVLAVSVVGLLYVLRTWNARRTIGLPMIACISALVLGPLLRSLPERIGLLLFLPGLWVVLIVIAIALGATVIELVKHKRRIALVGLLVSLIAIAIFGINLMTPWLWPYPAQ